MSLLSVEGLVKNYGRRRVVDGVDVASLKIIFVGGVQSDSRDVFTPCPLRRFSDSR